MADPVTAATTAAPLIANAGLLGVGAGIAMLGAAIGTGMVQSGVGSSAMGVIAEKPEESSKLLIYYLIPESILIFGFITAYLILSHIGA